MIYIYMLNEWMYFLKAHMWRVINSWLVTGYILPFYAISFISMNLSVFVFGDWYTKWFTVCFRLLHMQLGSSMKWKRHTVYYLVFSWPVIMTVNSWSFIFNLSMIDGRNIRSLLSLWYCPISPITSDGQNLVYLFFDRRFRDFVIYSIISSPAEASFANMSASSLPVILMCVWNELFSCILVAQKQQLSSGKQITLVGGYW